MTKSEKEKKANMNERRKMYRYAKVLGLKPKWPISMKNATKLVVNEIQRRVDTKIRKEREAESEAMIYKFRNDDKRMIGVSREQFKHDIQEKMKPGKEYAILIDKYNAEGFERVGAVILSLDSSDRDFNDAFGKISQTALKRWSYDGNPIIEVAVRVIHMPNKDSKVKGFKDGDVNCAVKPIIDILKETIKKTKNEKNLSKLNYRIEQANKINEEYFDSGIDEDGLKKLSKATQINISIYDQSGHKWLEVGGYKKATKHVMYFAKNKHFTVIDDLIKINDMDARNKEIEFHTFLDMEHINNNSHVLISKNQIIGIVNQDKVLKTKFYEYDTYPKCFSNGGVAKTKLIEMVPDLKNGMKEDDIYASLIWDSCRSGYYDQNCETSEDHTAYDQKSAYQSFKHSGCYRGIPRRINGIKNIQKMASCCDLSVAGLAYIKETHRRRVGKECVYYDADGWVPIEIVEDNLKMGHDVFVECMALATNTFDIDETVFTKDQFRSLIGKTQQKEITRMWVSNDFEEFKHGLFVLRERIVNTSVPSMEYKEYGDLVLGLPFTIEYKCDDKPWCLPIMATYVIAHQKHSMFKKHNELFKAGIEITAIKVDSIETKKRCDHLFDIGVSLGQWQFKPPQLTGNANGDAVIYREIPPIPKATIYSDVMPNGRLTHIAGSAGCGKTHRIIEIAKQWSYVKIVAPENKLCSALRKKCADSGIYPQIMTYHKMFGYNEIREQIGEFDTLIFDECSKIPAEELIKMLDKVPNKKIIIVGDFKQLQPVEGTIIDRHHIYDKFDKIELTKNYRQSEDKQFASVCEALRNKKYNECLDILNSRVIPINKAMYSGVNDIYLSGVNQMVDKINAEFEPDNGIKFINNDNRKHVKRNETGIYKDGLIVFEGGYTEPYNEKYHSKAMAITVHKAQGETYEGNVVIDTSRLFAENHLYVAVSRARSLDRIFLTQKILRPH